MFMEDFKAQLLELRRELTEAEATGAEAEGVVELDQTRQGRLSRMDAMQQQEMAKAGRAVQQRRLELARQALRALEAGTYGACRECGECIGYSRLKVKPEAPFCVECQGAKE